MALGDFPHYSFNGGEVSRHLLGRVDRDQMRFAAETMVNWLPLKQGPMMLRPGTSYLGRTRNNKRARLLPFVFSISETALIELTNKTMRVWRNDALVTRVAVSTTITNGQFSSQAGWELDATVGCSSVIKNGELVLTATARGGRATAKQTVAISTAADRTKEHALRIVVTRGPVVMAVGSAPNTPGGYDDLVARTSLDEGTHSIAFDPDGAKRFTIQFESADRREKKITECSIEGAGVMEITTPWLQADLGNIEYDQSGDILFTAADSSTSVQALVEGYQQYKIERRAPTSWSVVKYLSDDGPLRLPAPRDADVQMRSTTYEGNGIIESDVDFFDGNKHTGMLIRLFTSGQQNRALLGADGVFTEAIRVAGVESNRNFTVVIEGNFKGKLRLQASDIGPDSGFQNSQTWSWTEPTRQVLNDAEDNIIKWYRVGFESGDYRSGLADVYYTPAAAGSGGGRAGIARIISVQNPRSARMEVLAPFSSLKFTKDWMIGEWNGVAGYPSAVRFHDGRLWWAGRDRIWASVSDDYTSFDIEFEGEAGPISRSLGSGPVDHVAWLLGLSRLMVGRGIAVTSIRSSAFDEPLTPVNFTLKDAETIGVAPSTPVKIGTRGAFIDASRRKLYELFYNVDVQDYVVYDLNAHNLDIGLPGFSRIAVARTPDTRIYAVRDDGVLAVMTREVQPQPAESLAAWWKIEMDGTVEDVAVLPGDIEDSVYVIVNREGRRNVEKFARRDECVGTALTKLVDAHVVYQGAGTTTLTGLGHLNGKTVAVWGSSDSSAAATGRDLGTHIVRNGQITNLSISVQQAVVGLPYTAQFKSAKLAYHSQRVGTGLAKRKQISHVGLLLMDSHARGVKYGQDFEHLQNLPRIEGGDTVSRNQVWEQYEEIEHMLPGNWTVDTRLCLEAESPRPCTVIAAVVGADVP